MATTPVPKPGELEKELNEYLSRKYGDKVRLSVPLLMPDRRGDGTKDTSAKKKAAGRRQLNFDLKPRELEAYLDEYVVRQDAAKEILATKICTHFNRLKLRGRGAVAGNVKNNIIMIGPTGVGKTFLIRLIARKIGVPFVKGDATKFSETGYVGGDVEDLVRDLVNRADGDVEVARYGIIYIDEIDKIAGSKNAWGLDVSRTGVQRALLKPMEETEIDLSVPHDMVSQIEAVERYRRTGKREKRVINTRNILFIVSGAFNELEAVIERRIHQSGIGFGSSLKSPARTDELLQLVTAEDLVHYGFESEFVGRLPVIATFTALSADDLYTIIKNPNSAVLNSKKNDFLAYGIDIRFEDGALREIARQAADLHTGARGLVSVFERVLIKFEKILPSTSIRQFVVTETLVRDPAGEFERFMQQKTHAAMIRRHGELVRCDTDELRQRLLGLRESLRADWQRLVEEPYVDTIVELAATRYFDYRAILEDAARVMADIQTFESTFYRNHGITIKFDCEACDRIIARVLLENVATTVFLAELLENFQHGLTLIRDRTGTCSFVFNRRSIDAPQEYLNGLITQSYQQGI